VENINNSKYECCSPYFPTRSMCDLCEEMWNNEDLKLVDDKWLCEDCEDEYKRECEEENDNQH